MAADEGCTPSPEEPGPTPPSSTLTFLPAKTRTRNQRALGWLDQHLLQNSKFAIAAQIFALVECCVFWVFYFTVLKLSFERQGDVAFLTTEPRLISPIYTLLFFLSLKSLLLLGDVGFCARADWALVHASSMPLFLLQAAVSEPLFIDIPFGFLLFHANCIFRWRVMRSWVGELKLGLGLAQAVFAAVRWGLQLRFSWTKGAFPRRRRRVYALAGLALLSLGWSIGLRVVFVSDRVCTLRALNRELEEWAKAGDHVVPTGTLTTYAQILDLTVDTQDKLQLLANISLAQSNIPDHQQEAFLCDEPPRFGQRTILVVLNSAWPKWKSVFSNAGIVYTHIDDKATDFMDEEKQAYSRRRVMTKSSKYSDYQHSSYYPYEEIMLYLESLSRELPEFVELLEIGKSVEGRPMTVVKISAPASRRRRSGFWLDCGIHSREWITPATCLFTIDKLVSGLVSGETEGSAWETDWYILPLLNPDGYAWTWGSFKTRFWRKNRSNPGGLDPASDCIGADLNRNFDFAWGEPGCEADPCSVVYCGESAFSEPESAAVRNFVLENADGLGAFISLHSYSQMWFVPFGHQKANVSHDYEELMSVGREALSALEAVHGTRFRLGTAADLMYVTSGDSSDWAKGKAGIKLAFGVELRPAHCWIKHQFLLPASQIVATGEEMWAAFSVVADHLPLLPPAA